MKKSVPSAAHIHKSSGATPAPSISAVASCAALNDAAISALNKYTATATATTGMASSSYQVNLVKIAVKELPDDSAAAGMLLLFAICA